MKKSSILFILHLPPPVHGAAKVGAYIQQSRLINSSFSTYYINLSTSTVISEVGKGGVGKFINLIKINWKVLKALITRKFDLCYVTLTATGLGFYKDMATVFLLKLFGKKIIYHFHNKGIAKHSNSRLNNWLYRFAFRNTKTILLSPGLYADVQQYVPYENIFLCPNGIERQTAAANTKIVISHTSEPCRLLFLSNMLIEKGVLALLQACLILKEKAIPFECHFVGAWADFSENDFYHFVSANHLEKNVFVHGPKYNEEKNMFLKSADIFVLPTFYANECFPLVILEAMSYGLPVVSTTEGGIPDIITHNETGVIVKKNDSEDLALHLSHLIYDSKLRRQMGDAGKQKFLNWYTLEKFEENMHGILKQASQN